MELLLTDLLAFLREMITPNQECIELFIRWVLQFDHDSILALIKLYHKPELVVNMPLNRPHTLDNCPCTVHPNHVKVGKCLSPKASTIIKQLVPLEVAVELSPQQGVVYSLHIEPQKQLLSGVSKKLLVDCELQCAGNQRLGTSLSQFLQTGTLDELDVYEYELLTRLQHYISLRKLERYVPELYRSTDRGDMVNATNLSSLLSCMYRLHSYTLRYVNVPITEHCFFKQPLQLTVLTRPPAVESGPILYQQWNEAYDTPEYKVVVWSCTKRGSLFEYDNLGRKLTQHTTVLFPEYTTCQVLYKDPSKYIVLDVFIFQGLLQLHRSYSQRLYLMNGLGGKQLAILPQYDPSALCIVRTNTAGHQTVVHKLVPHELELQIIQPPWSGYKKVSYGDRVELSTRHYSKHLAKHRATFILTEAWDLYWWGINSLQYWCTLEPNLSVHLPFDRPFSFGSIIDTKVTLVTVYFDSWSPPTIIHLEPAPSASLMDVYDDSRLVETTHRGMLMVTRSQAKDGMLAHLREHCSTT